MIYLGDGIEFLLEIILDDHENQNFNNNLAQ